VTKMKSIDLVNLYEEKKKKYGVDTYKHISQLLEEAKVLHKKDWQKNPDGSFIDPAEKDAEVLIG